MAANNNFCVVSYNLHGFNQGQIVVRDLIGKLSIDIFLLQEHWLTPANLCLFSSVFPEYTAIGKSAMGTSVEQGPLRGRPFGGVTILVKNHLVNNVQILHCDDRYVIIKFLNYVIVNVYLPCVGTTDRYLLIEYTLNEIAVFLDSYLSEDVCENTVIIGGDFNTDLNLNDQASVLVKKIMTAYNLSRCDNDISKLNREDSVFTYCNEAMGHYSCIDYMLLSNENKLINYRVIEPDINLSDHRPICANFIAQSHIACHTENASDSGKNMKTVTQLRWDHADLVKYYHLTGLHVQCLMKEFDCQLISGCSKVDLLNYVYDNLIDILRYCASLSVPERRKFFL